MKISSLKEYFENKISVSSFEDLIHNELQDYVRGNLERGRSIPVTVIEDIELSVTNEYILKLCNDYKEGKLKELEVNYIADATLLSESIKFKNEKLFELVELLTDPAINGNLIEEVIEELINQLNKM